ncbi:MAG: tetratricopeptide repeat protein [bacterium]
MKYFLVSLALLITLTRLFTQPAMAREGASPAISESSPDSYIARGLLLVEQRHYREAIAVLEKALEIDPNRFETHWALGQAYYGLRRYDQAIEQLLRAAELTPDADLRGQMYYFAGLAATKHKMYRSARKFLMKAGDNPNAQELLRRLKEEDRKSQNLIAYGMFYNSNVAQAPDEISGIVGQDSLGMSLLYYGRMRVQERDRQATNLSLTLYGETNFDEQDFDVTEFSPAVTCQLGEFQFTYTFSQLKVGGDLFANRNKVLGIYEIGRFFASMEYGGTHYDQDYRDGVYFEGGLGQTLVKGRQWMKWALRVLNEDARDDAFSRLRYSAEARYGWPAGPKDRLSIGALWSNSRYEQPLAPYNLIRHDRMAGADVTLSHSLTDDTVILLNTSYKNSKSNIALFDYDRWFGKIEVDFSF